VSYDILMFSERYPAVYSAVHWIEIAGIHFVAEL